MASVNTPAPDGSRIVALKVSAPGGSRFGLAQGEIAVAVQPRLSSRTATDGERRMNAFAGRALTAPLLKAEQDARARRIALLNRALSAGVVDGLALAFDDAVIAAIDTAAAELPEAGLDLATPRRLTVEQGLGLTASGEEVIVPAASSFDALDLPVVAPGWLLSDAEVAPVLPPDADGSVLLARGAGRSLRALIAAGRPLPPVGVVVLEPVETSVVAGADPADQCERDLDAEAFEDQVRQDGTRLVFHTWPDEWLPLAPPGPGWRNALAHAVFEREAAMGDSQAMPWHGRGVPLALVAFNTAWQPLFADRGAVVRAGGRPRAGATAGLAAGTRFLWQARIEQFTEHLAEATQAGADTAALGAQMLTLPPAGLLPRDAVDARAGTNGFFPTTLDVIALPLPVEQLDSVLEASAGLAPIDLAVRDRLCVYVPVPQTLYDPRLLLTEVADADGAIAAALERYSDDRADWLRRRQRQRVQRLALQSAADGADNAQLVALPADDPLRTDDERLDPLVPAPAGLLHRSANVAGVHQHLLDHATRTLGIEASDMLYAWVLIDREQTPRTLMLQWQVGDSWEHRAYWGADLITLGVDGTPSRRQQSTATPPAVPTPGRWLRLEVPAEALGLVGSEASGIAFTLFDGQAVFGPTGVLRGGEERPWLDQATLDSGALRGDAEAWQFVEAGNGDTPFEDSFDTDVLSRPAPVGPAIVTRSSVELNALLADPLIEGRQLAPITGDDSKLTPTEGDPAKRGFMTLTALIRANGLRATVADLAGRIDEADDAINLGYLRVQTDLYRLRQTVLKQSQASRFAVSPALTQIADLDNASATREQLSGFYEAVKSSTAVQRADDEKAPPKFELSRTRSSLAGLLNPLVGPAPAVPRRMAAAPRPGVAVTSSLGISGRTPASSFVPVSGFTPIAPAPISVSPISVFGVGSGGVSAVGGGTALATDSGGKTRLDLNALGNNFGGINLVTPGFEPPRARPPAAAPPPAQAVTDSSALVGKAEIRTTSIASRMERPRAIEAKDFTVATRLEVIARLASLGLDLDELDVPGLAETRPGPNNTVLSFDVAGQPLRAAGIKLKALRLDFGRLSSDPDPSDKTRDESAYFLGGVDLSDHTIAVLRAAEGIVRRYRDALQRCQKSLVAIDTSLARLAPRLALVERELAESRQDVATARALLAEEVQRALDTNAERDRIIAEHVRFLAFARPRIGSRVAALATRELDSSLEPDAVPACLADHDEAPGDVAAMLQVVRRAPVDWFPAMRAHLNLLDTPLAADRVLSFLPLSAQAIAATSVSAVTLVAGLAGSASQQVAFSAVRAQADSVAQARTEALPLAQAALVGNIGLLGKIALIARSASLADLAGAAAERNLLNRRVTDELARISAVATCLHARLSTVRAAIRLDWAERFSQFDRVGDLGDLSGLPRFAELPRDDRDDIRELAAWLRRRADAGNPRAVALLNDLVRVCLLAASHSPAGTLLTGRLLRPVPLHPGIRFEVQPALPDRLRIGMQVQVFDPVFTTAQGATRIAAHAVVEDIVAGVAQVKVLQAAQAGFTPSARASVQFLLR